MRHSAFRRISICTSASIMLAGSAYSATAAPTSPAETEEFLREATSACRRGEFYEFLEAFIASGAVRARYRDVPSEPFRIGKVDYANLDPSSVALSNPDPNKRFRELAVDVTDLPGKGCRLTYQPGIFQDDGEGNGRTLVRRIGMPKSYDFAWKNGCWRLSKAGNLPPAAGAK